MTPEERREYVAYRLARARETLAEARVLLDAGHLHGSVNRVYYAMFNAVNALALSHGFSTSSHSQLRGYFNREFVKTGKISVELGRAFGLAFDSRTKGDYQDLAQFDAEQVSSMLETAVRFVDVVAGLSAADQTPG